MKIVDSLVIYGEVMLILTLLVLLVMLIVEWQMRADDDLETDEIEWLESLYKY